MLMTLVFHCSLLDEVHTLNVCVRRPKEWMPKMESRCHCFVSSWWHHPACCTGGGVNCYTVFLVSGKRNWPLMTCCKLCCHIPVYGINAQCLVTAPSPNCLQHSVWRWISFTRSCKCSVTMRMVPGEKMCSTKHSPLQQLYWKQCGSRHLQCFVDRLAFNCWTNKPRLVDIRSFVQLRAIHGCLERCVPTSTHCP